MSFDEDNYDMVFKVVIIGDQHVGKTNILSRYIKGKFIENTRSTVGVEFGCTKMMINKYAIKVQIWDTAGQERYKSVTSSYYKGAKGALIVYDITLRSSFDNVVKWLKDLKYASDPNIVIMLIGNKCDLASEREVSIDEGYQLAYDYSKRLNLDFAFLETSAKTNQNIDNAFSQMMIQVFNNFMSTIDNGLCEHNSNEKDLCKSKDLKVLNLRNRNKKKCCK